MECQCHSESHTKEVSAGTYPLPPVLGAGVPVVWQQRLCPNSTSPQWASRAAALGSQDSLPLPPMCDNRTFSEAGGTQATALLGLGKRRPQANEGSSLTSRGGDSIYYLIAVIKSLKE